MDLAKTLAQLHADLDNLNAAIASLERIQRERGLSGLSQRGRPGKAERPKAEVKKERRRRLSPD